MPLSLRSAYVTLNLRMLLLCGDNYLPGPRYKTWKVEIADTRTKIIRKVQEPTIMTKVQFFLGLCDEWFVPNFSRVAVPLNKELRKNQRNYLPEFTKEESQLVEKSKKTLTNPPVLSLPRATGYHTLGRTPVTKKSDACYCNQNRTDPTDQSVIGQVLSAIVKNVWRQHP